MEPKEGTPRSVAGQSEAGVKSWTGWWVEPFPCRVWCYLQVDSIRTELRGRTSTWCRELFGVGEDPHSRTGVSSTIILRCKGLLTSPGRSEDKHGEPWARVTRPQTQWGVLTWGAQWCGSHRWSLCRGQGSTRPFQDRSPPSMSSACLLSGEKLQPKNKFIEKVRKCRSKGN